MFSTQIEFVQNMSLDHHEALNWLSGGDYEKFNKSMRKNRPLDSTEQKNLKLIDEIFYRIPPLKDSITVYKGKKSKNLYTDKAFVSTSIELKQAMGFTGNTCCIVQITVPPGAKIIPMRNFSSSRYEEEILLDRDGELICTGTDIIERHMNLLYASYIPKKHSSVENAEKVFDNDLVIERIIEFFSDEDPEFLDAETISIQYRTITGVKISRKDLEKIKERLNVE